MRLSKNVIIAVTQGGNDNPNANGQGQEPSFSYLVKQVSLGQLQDEPKRLLPGAQNEGTNGGGVEEGNPYENICQNFLKVLLRPKENQHYSPIGGKFPFKSEDIVELANQCAQVFLA